MMEKMSWKISMFIDGQVLALLLSPFCFQKPIWGSARQESSHPDGMGSI